MSKSGRILIVDDHKTNLMKFGMAVKSPNLTGTHTLEPHRTSQGHTLSRSKKSVLGIIENIPIESKTGSLEP
jgi:hypothetical protein